MSACECVKNEDGKCDYCSTQLYLFVKGTVEKTIAIAESMEQACNECFRLEFDLAGAKFIREHFKTDLSPKAIALLEGTLQGMKLGLSSRGIATPQLDHELKKLRERLS